MLILCGSGVGSRTQPERHGVLGRRGLLRRGLGWLLRLRLRCFDRWLLLRCGGRLLLRLLRCGLPAPCLLFFFQTESCAGERCGGEWLGGQALRRFRGGGGGAVLERETE